MADKTIGDLAAANVLYDTDLMILEQSGEAKNMPGTVLKNYLKPYADAAEAASEAAESALAGVKDAINNIPEGAATPIVNDLTTGGASMALSAEMGKELKSELDGLTPEDIGAVAGIWTIYRDITQLGLTAADVTLSKIHEAMANFSTAILSVTTAMTNLNVPNKYGILYVEKHTTSRCYAKFYQVDGREYFAIIYSSTDIRGWYQTATTDYAVPLDGSKAMTGNLNVYVDSIPRVILRAANGGKTEVAKNASSVVEGGTYIKDEADSGLACALNINGYSGLSNALALNKDGKNYPILHTGNKPSGSYTGNGSAASRTIDTGGIGNVCAIYTEAAMGILTPGGFIGKNSEGTIVTLAAGAAKYVNGIITLATKESAVNYNGSTYIYQVL